MKYISTIADVAKTTRSMLDSAAQVSQGRVNYLRMLIATTQHEHTNDKPLLATLRLVHGKFYAAILAVIDEKAPDPIVRNAQSNFARTAFSAVFQFIRGGGDLTKLNAETVTKGELAVTTVAPGTKPITAAVGVKRVTSLAERICAGDRP